MYYISLLSALYFALEVFRTSNLMADIWVHVMPGNSPFNRLQNTVRPRINLLLSHSYWFFLPSNVISLNIFFFNLMAAFHLGLYYLSKYRYLLNEKGKGTLQNIFVF